MPSTLTFADALEALRGGASYTLCGSLLTVNGVALAITGEQFDEAYDLLDAIEGDDFGLRLPGDA